MSNPLFNQMQPQNQFTQMMQRFQQFQKSFSGNPAQQIQQMMNSGKISQPMYNQAVQMAQQFSRMFGK